MTPREIAHKTARARFGKAEIAEGHRSDGGCTLRVAGHIVRVSRPWRTTGVRYGVQASCCVEIFQCVDGREVPVEMWRE